MTRSDGSSSHPVDAAARPHITPRLSAGLPQLLGQFDTLIEGLEYAARGQTGFNFYGPRGALDHVLSYAELRERALEAGRRLIRAGLQRGQRVSVVAETGPEFMEVFFGCQYAGLIPCPVPYSMYIGGRDAYVGRLVSMMRAANVSAVVARAELIGQVGEAAKLAGVRLVLSHDELAGISSADVDLSPFGKDDVAYIQYSSGSTSDPKGVLISQKAVTANTRGILHSGLDVQPGDRGFSWLPLYHDMGLVGFCLSPMMSQSSVDYMATPAFARRPALWLKIMSDNQCNCAYGPSFGYDLAARRVNGGAADLDLSNWRVAGIGGDMVRADVLERFAEALAPAGFNANAFLPSYGMAEATLAVTFAPLKGEVEIDILDRAKTKSTNKAVPAHETGASGADATRSFVLCGKPLAGHEIEVRDDRGRALKDRRIGHILIRGPSLMVGYFGNSDATAQVMDGDGWLKTGDMGYLLNGQIVITGRSKDMILHNGRNIWPQDIEWAVECLDELRDGDVAAFAVEGEDGEDNVVVLLHCRLADPAAREALRHRAAAIVHQQSGIECDIVLVPPKSLPFTSSGKLSRAGARQGYLSGDIAEIAAGRAAAPPAAAPEHPVAVATGA